MAAAPVLLKPACELAPRVVLPADPHLALALAQALTEAPRMFNHHAGLWGYTGTAPDGAPLSVQATGLGGPSAAVIAWELAGLGAEVLVRVGEARGLDGGVRAGVLLAVEDALSEDGTARALGGGKTVAGDRELTTRIAARASAAGRVASSDLFYDPEAAAREARWIAEGCVARDLESAAILRVAALRGVRAACVLAVVEDGESGRLDREDASALGVAAGRAAWNGLARPAPRPP